jgi:uncharacterized integral membrane protein (TIGR00698 family)
LETAFQQGNLRPKPPFAILPGLLLTSSIAAAAFALRALPGAGAVNPMILAIVIGIVLRNLFGTPERAGKGIAFSLRRVLRFAIILLGLQLTAAQLAEIGTAGAATIVLTLCATFVFTTWFGRLLGVERGLAELIAAGTSICGASAVIAANTVTRAPDEDVAYAVACITVFGSVAMFCYPLLPDLLDLSAHAYGLWAGATIHEIAQVVAAAYQDGRQAGDAAMIAKLSRVILLAPVVVSLGLLARRRNAGGTGGVPAPWFLLGFLALVGINSAVAIPAGLKEGAAVATAFLLCVALAAMGLETDMGKLRAKGLRPLLLGASASLFIAGFGLALVKATT